MNRATIIGIGGGVLLGAVAGTIGQAVTRVESDVTQQDRDEWRERFDDHFADDVLDDAHRAAELDDQIRRDLREHDPPRGVEVSRHGGSMRVVWDEEPHRRVYGTLAAVGGVIGLGAGIALACTAGPHAGDMHRFRGFGGALTIGLPFAATAFLVANVASNLIMDAHERGRS